MWCAELTDEQREIQQLSRKFAREEIIPRAAHHDETGEVVSFRDVVRALVAYY